MRLALYYVRHDPAVVFDTPRLTASQPFPNNSVNLPTSFDKFRPMT